jgi:hypothetical protein
MTGAFLFGSYIGILHAAEIPVIEKFATPDAATASLIAAYENATAELIKACGNTDVKINGVAVNPKTPQKVKESLGTQLSATATCDGSSNTLTGNNIGELIGDLTTGYVKGSISLANNKGVIYKETYEKLPAQGAPLTKSLQLIGEGRPLPADADFSVFKPEHGNFAKATWGTTATNSFSASLSFAPLKEVYRPTEKLEIDLNAKLTVPTQAEQVDLWVVISAPHLLGANQYLFLTPKPLELFSTEPQAFQFNLASLAQAVRVLSFDVPTGLGGQYTFFAAFVSAGKNPFKDGFSVLKSDIASAQFILTN